MSVTLKQKPNGIYYIDTQLPDGQGGVKRGRISFDTRDKNEAEGQRRDWIAGVHPKHPAMGGVVAAKGRAAVRNASTSTKVGQGPTVERWLVECLSDPDRWGKKKAMATLQSNVRILSAKLPKGLLLDELSTTHVNELTKALRDEEYAEGSVVKLLGSLKAAVNFAVKSDTLLNPPRFPSIEVNNEKDRIVTLDEEKVMFECIRDRQLLEPLRAWWHFERLMVILIDTGIRLGEAMASGPSRVKRKRWLDRGEQMEGLWLALPRGTTKNNKPRDVPLTQRAIRAIDELAGRLNGVRWFPWAMGSSGPLYLLQAIREDMRKRGFDFDDVVLHTMRHTCATRLAENGMDLLGLRDWLGHSDIKVTAKRYIHLMNGHVYRGVAILDTVNGTLPPVQDNADHDVPNSTKWNYQPSSGERASDGMAHVH